MMPSRRKLGRLVALVGAAGIAALPRKLFADTATTRSDILTNQIKDNTTGLVAPLNMRNAYVTQMGPPATLTPAAGAVTWPLATAPIATVTLTANTTITVTGGEDGMAAYRLAIIQGGAGNFVPTLAGVTLSSSPVLATTAGTSNRVYVDCVGDPASGGTRMADII